MTFSLSVRRPAITALAAAVVGSALLVACSSSDGASVVASTAAPRTLHFNPTGSGVVMASVDRAVIVERRATVLEVAAVEGQYVRAGQTLLRVYTIGQSLAVAELTNTLRAEEQRLPFYRSRYGKFSSQAALLVETIGQDREQLTRLKATPTVLRAPVSGRIAGLTTVPGATLDRSDAAFHIIDDSRVRVAVSVPASYRWHIRSGMTGVLSLPSLPGHAFAAEVVGVGGVVPALPDGKQASTAETVPVTVSLTNPGGIITPGSAAYVRFPLVEHAEVAVDSLAVLDQSTPYVFLIQGHVARQRAIVPGVSDGRWTEILHGVSAGDDVVISGGHELVDGTRVSATRDTG